MKVLSVAQTRDLDRRSIEEGKIPGFTLMERAGQGAAEQIISILGKNIFPNVRKILILAGKGNNGGDGYTVAKYLADKTSLDVIIFSICKLDELKGDAAAHAAKLPKNVSCEFRKNLFPSDFSKDSLVVDALLGTGFSGVPNEKISQWINALNKSGLPVVSLDLPSGLDGDSGKVYGSCVCADFTITFGTLKRGLFLNDALDKTGVLRFVPIGIPEKYFDECESELNALIPSEALALLPRHSQSGNKFSRGIVAVIGGSRKYSGAPALAASSALAAGAGFVSLIIPDKCEISNLKNAIIKIRAPSENGVFCPSSINSDMITTLARANAVCAGPGITTAISASPLIHLLWQSGKKIVFDADALNIIAGKKFLKRKYPGVMTPHEGEMKRLAAGYGVNTSKDRFSQAQELASKTGNVIVLKGPRTVIAGLDGKDVYVNMTGSSALASAGTGDVLAGIITSFLAQGLSPENAALLGTFIHGSASETYIRSSLNADTLVKSLSST
jgi:NAD(P)H-hydrate epimerase